MNTNPIFEFEEIVNMIVGVYTDATIGFDIYQSKLGQISENSSPDAKVFFGSGNPNDPATEVDHVAVITEVVSRNMETGSNFRFIGNMCLISIYQYWEDDYRKKIAELFHKKKNDLTEPIMGDIKELRNLIIHHKAIALPKVKKCILLKWYQEGDEIFINKEQFKEIIKHIRAYINKLKSEYKNLK
ncbi:hypothetical protein H6F96_28050 [Microcoleus sp. FACHB-53]|nr:hypothetical protein [Microcoleus sp. FACHB-53]